MLQEETADQKTQEAPASETGDKNAWTARDSEDLYRVGQWGQQYFAINQDGNVTVHPDQLKEQGIDLKKLIEQLKEQGIQLPVLVRFGDILKHRIDTIHGAFNTAIETLKYQGGYNCIYPIKVNQQRHVVEEIISHGKQHKLGIEVGSKPELLAAMSMITDDDTQIICNGFKDAEYIEAVILAAKLGRKMIPVVENFSELNLIAQYAQAHNVKPLIGMRVKLSAKGAGRWESSGGHRSKFGLFPSELLEAVTFLEQRGMLDCFRLLHFHIGSQVNNIRNIKNAVIELTRIYVELRRLGAGLDIIDVGGGLGVDYDGSKSASDSSINYGLQEYANDIVFHIQQVCDQAGVQHPHILSESGRSLAAYHSVLIFNVLGRSSVRNFLLPDRKQIEAEISHAENELPQPVRIMADSYLHLNSQNYIEYYHDALQARDATIHLFNLGYCSLVQRSLAEKLYFGICNQVLEITRELKECGQPVPHELEGLDGKLCDIYFCNWSIFQSLPDSWAIEQVFPIMPIHRLNEKPTSRGILCDITCDSDGKLDRFLPDADQLPEPKAALELHDISEGQDYELAVFLVGAYQEILGDMHNLFGDTNAVHVGIDQNGEPKVESFIEGDTVREVLEYVQYSANQLRRNMRTTINVAVSQKRLTRQEGEVLLRFYESGLEGYTYLE